MLPIRDQIKKTTYNSEFIEKAEERWRANEGEEKKTARITAYQKKNTTSQKFTYFFPKINKK